MTSIFVFVSGAAVLIYSADKLVGYLVGAASRLLIPVFLLAVIFTGIEFDDVALGVALNLDDLKGVALGLVFGTAVSFSGIVLALAIIIKPTKITLPRDYLAIFAVAPLLMIVITLTSPIGIPQSVILLALFVLFLVYIAVREHQRSAPTFQSPEVYEHVAAGATDTDPSESGPDGGIGTKVRQLPYAQQRGLSGWANIGLAVLALVGIIIGAQTTSMGTEGILHDYHLDGTVFGATIATIVLTGEDIVLTVQPFRNRVPLIGIGNVIGSLVFSVTAKLGIIVLAGGSIVAGAGVLEWHLPALIVMTAVAAWVLSTGDLRRWHGWLLLALYIVYWVISFTVFGTVPIED
ncbi:sodium:calcium antiporter [Spelaeicoccus albus]|uniref:Cation:H+ antiporter n=1 Tax=Spelaeicoccus albus TaxID=1280376 RepID=A0A7Z0D188_9MICO|nr:sodium:proton exchanger [Spelaeicoccus albus]NYI65847.1 cation:H+ antiporter [Spelaeicoccus albus]